MLTISERIFSLMIEMKLSQKEMSEYTGISEGTISSWKKRGSSPSAEYIPAIANFLGVSCDFLLTGKDSKQNSICDDAFDLAKEYQLLDARSKAIIKGEIYRRSELMNSSNEFAEEFRLQQKAT